MGTISLINTKTYTMKNQTPPINQPPLTWRQVGKIIHRKSYNGVMNFIVRNGINPIKLEKGALFDPVELYAALERNKVRLC
jgi:hypothetical protein